MQAHFPKLHNQSYLYKLKSKQFAEISEPSDQQCFLANCKVPKLEANLQAGTTSLVFLTERLHSLCTAEFYSEPGVAIEVIGNG